MVKLNLSQAAKHVGVSRQTFYRHIEKKGISVSLDDNNRKVVDVSELVRVYGETLQVDTPSNVTTLHSVTPQNANLDRELHIKVAVLEERLSGKDDLIERLEREIRDLKHKEDESQKLITDLRVQAAEKPAQATFSIFRPSTWVGS